MKADLSLKLQLKQLIEMEADMRDGEKDDYPRGTRAIDTSDLNCSVHSQGLIVLMDDGTVCEITVRQIA